MKEIKLIDLVQVLEDGSRFVVRDRTNYIEYEKEDFLSEKYNPLKNRKVESFRFSTGFNLILIEV